MPSTPAPSTPAPSTPAASTSKISDIVDVTCTPTSTRVSVRTVAARPDGVHVRVRNTSGASGVYLNYSSATGAGGGDGVGTAPSVHVLSIGPGTARVHCSTELGRREDAPVSIEVRDPTRSWRTGALAAAGCAGPNVAVLDWAFTPIEQPTAAAALEALIIQMDQPTTWQPAQEGYAASARQTYVLWRAGKPWVVASTNRAADGSYKAYGDSLCNAPAS